MRAAGGEVRCPVGSRCLGAGPTRVYGIGWARGVGRFSEKGRVRVSLGPFASQPPPLRLPFRGAPVGGGGQGTPGFPLVRRSSALTPSPSPLPAPAACWSWDPGVPCEPGGPRTKTSSASPR